MKFESKRERYIWIKKTSPEMLKVITEINEKMGPVKLSNVGLGEFPVKPEPVNLWANYGVRLK